MMPNSSTLLSVVALSRSTPLTRTTAPCDWTDHPYIGRIHLEAPRNTDCPSKLASCEPLTERRAQPITGIRQHAAKAHVSLAFSSNPVASLPGYERLDVKKRDRE